MYLTRTLVKSYPRQAWLSDNSILIKCFNYVEIIASWNKNKTDFLL